ncbi:hypothetical protein [Terrihabitans sp. B22-R8]|uniref:hypothetical protein n=1 Tax=Terrihabitans sp. B22-R8 TaxID=3425128 RepID=UPI00403C1035
MTKSQTLSPEQAARAERLAASLRENLKRRKQQARGRRTENTPASPPSETDKG